MSNPINLTTSTQIKNLYSPGVCYLNIKFFNTDLSLKFSPFIQTNNGRSEYDLKNCQITTIDHEEAFTLYITAKDIIEGKLIEGSQEILCKNATLTLERSIKGDKPETVLSLTKNNVTIPFIFNVRERKIKSNGQVVGTEYIEAGLGSFMQLLEGYLTGVNADRHLDKLTDDYAAAQNQAKSNNNNQNSYQGNNNSGYKKSYNNYNKKSNYQGGYNNQRYNNQNNGPKPSWGNNTQSMNNYNING